MPRVLVVEDEPSIRKMVAFALKQAGFEVATADDGRVGLDEFERFKPDAVLLDVLLPSLSGYEVCERIRSTSDVPILMLTALAQEDDLIRGLQLGADDYLTKPFSVRLLVRRVNLLLHRDGRDDGGVLSIGELVVDLGRCEAHVRGSKVDLTPTEFRILSCLARNAGRVITSRVLLRDAQDYECDRREAQNIVKVHIRHLRTKLELDPESPKYILNVRGVGYLIDGRYSTSSAGLGAER